MIVNTGKEKGPKWEGFVKQVTFKPEVKGVMDEESAL